MEIDVWKNLHKLLEYNTYNSIFKLAEDMLKTLKMKRATFKKIKG